MKGYFKKLILMAALIATPLSVYSGSLYAHQGRDGVGNNRQHPMGSPTIYVGWGNASPVSDPTMGSGYSCPIYDDGRLAGSISFFVDDSGTQTTRLRVNGRDTILRPSTSAGNLIYRDIDQNFIDMLSLYHVDPAMVNYVIQNQNTTVNGNPLLKQEIVVAMNTDFSVLGRHGQSHEMEGMSAQGNCIYISVYVGTFNGEATYLPIFCLNCIFTLWL